MAAQTISSSPAAPHQAAASNSADSVKSKRARTKHACDECRRSQKKCDGERPLCRRCYLNGTHCTYTPHKSRSQCACTGQSEETRTDTSVPDVFIFPDCSFHTWSATSSPDQSPSVSGSALETPSPTNLSQDIRFGTAQNAVIEHPAAVYESSKNITQPETTRRGRHLYSHRSYSLPSFSNTSSISPSPHATEFSTYPLSASLPHDFAKQIAGTQESGLMTTAQPAAIQTEQDMDLVVLSAYNQFQLRQSQLTQGSSPSECMLGTPALYSPHSPEAHHDQGQTRFLNAEELTGRMSNQKFYEMQQYAMDQCPQPSFVVENATSFPTDYPSRLDHPSHEYSPWIDQGHAHNVAPISSHARPSHEVQSTPQLIHYDVIGNPNYFVLDQTSRAAENLVSPPHLNAPDLSGLPSPSVGRQIAETMLLNLPSPRFSQMQWGNEPVSPPFGGSYPSSVNPSPSAYDWSH